MVRNKALLRRFEKQRIAGESVDVQKNFQIINALYKEAFKLGIFPYKVNKLDISHKIKIAYAINHVSKIT